ncbi:MAG: FKBP-type peptidyl-prolyl cis-trans isomerase [Planctomycetaceae bacterium]
MRSSLTRFWLVAGLVGWCAPPVSRAAEPAEPVETRDEGFVSLLAVDGQTGWETIEGARDAASVNEGLLTCRAGVGWLRTTQVYSDFVLRVEFRLSAGGSAGLGLRLPVGRVPRPGIEVELLDEGATGGKAVSMSSVREGAVRLVRSARRPEDPNGDWSACEVSCRGGDVRVVFDDEVVSERPPADEAQARGAVDDERPRVGRIGVRATKGSVEIRKLELRNLATVTKSGLSIVDLGEGNGAVVPSDARIVVHFTCWLPEGRKLDSTRDLGEAASVRLPEAIRGWQEGIVGMKVGGRRKLVVPPGLAYGDKGVPPVIPPQATLVFDIEVLEVR